MTPDDLPVSPEVAVVGLGSVLTGDDALGPTAVALLRASWETPPGVLVLDAGTPGTDLASHIGGCRALVVVDTVAARGEPGELRLYRRADLLDRPLQPRVNPHAPGLQETLLVLELLGRAPEELLVVGVVPSATDVGVGLSEPVRTALPAVLENVVAELDRLGVAPRRRPEPLDPDLWWERAAGPRIPGSGGRRESEREGMGGGRGAAPAVGPTAR